MTIKRKLKYFLVDNLKRLSTFLWRQTGILQYQGVISSNSFSLYWFTFNWYISHFLASKVSKSFGYECWMVEEED